MFPDITGENGFQAALQRASGIAFLRDDKLSKGIQRKPGPTASEEGCGSLGEMFLESIESAKIPVDEVDQLSSRKSTTVRTEAVPVECVVPDLGGIVENPADCFFDDLFSVACSNPEPGSNLFRLVT